LDKTITGLNGESWICLVQLSFSRRRREEFLLCLKTGYHVQPGCTGRLHNARQAVSLWFLYDFRFAGCCKAQNPGKIASVWMFP